MRSYTTQALCTLACYVYVVTCVLQIYIAVVVVVIVHPVVNLIKGPRKVKLAMHKRIQEVLSDAGTRLLFKFRSGTHGLRELGRHRGREGKLKCTFCGAECESVVHVLWECTACSSSRASFTERLQELLGDSYTDFDLLSNVEKTSYVLGSEHWEKNLLFIVKSILWMYGK